MAMILDSARLLLLVPIFFVSTGTHSQSQHGQANSSSTCTSIAMDLVSSFVRVTPKAHALQFDVLVTVKTLEHATSLRSDSLRYSTKLMSVFPESEWEPALARLGNGKNQNITQMSTVILFPCAKNDNELLEIMTNLKLYYQSDLKARNWRPVFVLVNPELVTNRFYINDTHIQKLAQNLEIDTDIYILHQIVNSTNSSFANSEWLLKEYYSIRNQTIIHEVVWLKSLKELDLSSLIFSKTRRRSNFERAPVIAIGTDDPAYPLATKFKPDTLELESGFEVYIYQYFRDALNFTERAVKSIGYIREGAGGHLVGLPVQLNKGEGDIAIGAAEFLEWRMKGPDGLTFLHPMFYANIYAYFKQPAASSVRNIFTQTFTTWLWVASFAMWTFIVIVLKWSVRVKSRQPGLQIREEDAIIARDGVIWALGVICSQGWYKSPSSGPTRTIFLTGIFTGLILFTAYSAALVSILSVEVVPIQSFDDLIRENFFITSDSHIPTAKFVVKGLEESGQIKNLGEASRNIELGDKLKTLTATRYAVVTISDSFYPILEQANFTEAFVCTTISVKPVGRRPLKESCTIRRGAPFREWLNTKMIQMHERGVREKLINGYVLDTSVQCLESSSAFQAQLGLRDVFTAYVILVMGMAIGGMVSVIEKFFYFKKMKSTGGDQKQ